MSCAEVYSAGAWLMPPLLGTKIMGIGATCAIALGLTALSASADVMVGGADRPTGDVIRAALAYFLAMPLDHLLRLEVSATGQLAIPADNPFVNREGARPEIWSYGHRNAQGLALHPETGDLWLNEHGPQGGDELNLIQPGLNYGWPVIGYGVNYRTGLAIHNATHREGMEQPVHVWVPSIGISGLMVYTGDRFPEWRGNIFVGGMVGERVARLTMDGQRVISEETLVQGRGRIRDIRQGPDGYIYLVTEHRDGQPTPILRMEPVERTAR